MRYLISYGSMTKDDEQRSPEMAMMLDGDKLTVTVIDGLSEDMFNYFEQPRGGWTLHKDQNDPLESFADSASMLDANVTSQQEEYDQAVSSIDSSGGKTRTF